MYENGCKNLRTDVHTVDMNDIAVDVENSNEEVEVDIGFKNARERIAVGLSVVVVEKLDMVVD